MRVPLWSPSLPAVFPHVGHNTSQAGSGTFWPRACRVLGLLPQQSVFRPLPTCARFAHCWRWRAMRARAWQSGLVDAGGRPRDTTRKAAAVTGVRCGGRASDAVDEPWRLRTWLRWKAARADARRGAPRSCWCSRTCASTRRRPRTTPATRRSWPRAPTSTSTTRSAPRTARTRPPRVRRPARPPPPAAPRGPPQQAMPRRRSGASRQGRGATEQCALARARAALLSRARASAPRPRAPAPLAMRCRLPGVALRAAWPYPSPYTKPTPSRRRDQVPEAQRGGLPAAEGAGLPGRRGRQPQAALRGHRGRLQGVVQDRRHRVAHQQGRQDHPRVRAGGALRRCKAR